MNLMKIPWKRPPALRNYFFRELPLEILGECNYDFNFGISVNLKWEAFFLKP